jgi:hypothetical protein
MRTFARFFGLLCGSVVIAIAARYGFKTSDNDFDGYIWAFTYGSVTLGGLFGHSLAVRVWRHNQPIGALVMMVSAFALVISLSNSLGAMAGRGNEQQAERMRVADTVRDLRRGLDRAEAERKELKFEAADEAAVSAARAKATAATAAKEAECQWRGQRCRDKETAEGTALAALEAATRNKAATDRAAKLDSDIAAFREKIEKAGPVLEANSQGNALARLFNLPEANAATLSTYQNLAMAMVIELLIVISLVASEVLDHHETKASAPSIPAEQTAAARALRKPVEAVSVIEALSSIEETPKAFPAPPRPRLIASRPDPLGNVAVIMAEIMEPGRGKAELADVFAAYVEACQATGKRPIPANEFPAAIAALCERIGIEIEDNAKGVFLLKVRLKRTQKTVGL